MRPDSSPCGELSVAVGRKVRISGWPKSWRCSPTKFPMPPESESRETLSRFEKLLVALAARDVDFCVVGGLAVILNGHVRLTEDVDVLVSEAPDNIQRLLEVLRGWGEGWARELQPEEFVVQEGAIRVQEEFDLDIFTRMRGRSIEDFRPRFRYFVTGGKRIAYLSPADLILLKQGSFRDKDQQDTLAMHEALRREQQP